MRIEIITFEQYSIFNYAKLLSPLGKADLVQIQFTREAVLKTPMLSGALPL